MRISDGSSDVCSSDLERDILAAEQELDAELLGGIIADLDDDRLDQHLLTPRVELADQLAEHPLHFGIRRDNDRVRAFVARDDGGAARRDAAAAPGAGRGRGGRPASRSRSEEHTSALQSLMRNSYAVFCLQKKKEA